MGWWGSESRTAVVVLQPGIRGTSQLSGVGVGLQSPTRRKSKPPKPRKLLLTKGLLFFSWSLIYGNSHPTCFFFFFLVRSANWKRLWTSGVEKGKAGTAASRKSKRRIIIRAAVCTGRYLRPAFIASCPLLAPQRNGIHRCCLLPPQLISLERCSWLASGDRVTLLPLHVSTREGRGNCKCLPDSSLLADSCRAAGIYLRLVGGTGSWREGSRSLKKNK